MAGAGVGRWRFSDRYSTADVAPVIRANALGVDPQHLDGVDRFQAGADLYPCFQVEEDFGAGGDERNAVEGLACFDRTENPEARERGAIIAGLPMDQGEDGAGGEGNRATAAIVDDLINWLTETEPALEAVLEPYQLDLDRR